MEEQKEFQTVTLTRGCIVGGKAQKAGTTLDVKIPDAQLLIHSNKAVPQGDDREEGIKAAAAAAAKKDAKK